MNVSLTHSSFCAWLGHSRLSSSLYFHAQLGVILIKWLSKSNSFFFSPSPSYTLFSFLVTFCWYSLYIIEYTLSLSRFIPLNLPHPSTTFCHSLNAIVSLLTQFCVYLRVSVIFVIYSELKKKEEILSQASIDKTKLHLFELLIGKHLMLIWHLLTQAFLLRGTSMLMYLTSRNT